MSLTVLYWILIAVMLVGIVGAVIPGVPGPSLILGAIVVWGLVNGFSSVGWALGVVIAVLILGTGVELLASYWGRNRQARVSGGRLGQLSAYSWGFSVYCPLFWWLVP